MAHVFSHLTCAALTDLGRKRKNNEDAFGRYPENGMFCVADGMGGAEDGEVASQAVVEGLSALFERLNKSGRPYSGAAAQAWIAQAVNDASAWIYNRSEERGTRGTGSTFVGVCFDPAEPGKAMALHAGDSRLYLLRKKTLTQITRDHSAAALAGVKDEKDLNPMFRGIVMRAVGVAERVELELTPFGVAEGDWVLLCSDGLTRMVEDKEIATLIRKAGTVEAAARALIDRANQNGGVDNVTVVLIRVGRLPAAVTDCAQDLPGAVPPDKAGERETRDTNRADTDTDSPRPYVCEMATPSTAGSGDVQPFDQEAPTEDDITPDTAKNTEAGVGGAEKSPKRGKRLVFGSVVAGGLFGLFVLARGVGWTERNKTQDRALAGSSSAAEASPAGQAEPAPQEKHVARPSATGAVRSSDKPVDTTAARLAEEKAAAEAAAKAEAARLQAAEVVAREEAERKRAEEAQRLAAERLAKEKAAAEAAAKAEAARLQAAEVAARRKADEAQRLTREKAAAEQARDDGVHQAFLRLAGETNVLERFVTVAASFDDENARRTARAVIAAAQAIAVAGKGTPGAEDDRLLADFIGSLANAAGFMDMYLDNEWLPRLSGLMQPGQTQAAERLVKQMEGLIRQRGQLGDLSKAEARMKLDELVRLTAECVKQWQEIPGFAPARR